ncbi:MULTISPECIES: molybdopterin biosynthesis protein [Psychrilyobacter]|uniref:Molybdopterin molybdenumtransferase n=1 Tax=Psychrilyobacter piezotolerans TaxID=2293438 RepID=A0ABX9KLI8_9FUSO|nr:MULTISPECIES: molybdopterin biosynthesis protein [Psychrilyobacter]MCS5422292.1 molybdopterin biosynthesis protein [Psychrilyobacter sp. S5]NDI76492.1 molybdopterin biosynthesis protein [Psychrilyobacter piezotolerans]RDE66084.1 molybdopterin biosynthesis protein [Psychrilyobacter sp. S5]REI43262.1 molybdopterin biosynthesis protein [Psychrilyobacter piezotolerans]
MRNTFIDNISLEETKPLFFNRIEKYSKKETIPTEKSLGRVTSSPVFANVSSPNFNASAMDGILVRSKDTETASETNPVTLKKDKDFLYVNTGNPVNPEFDAVIMIEEVVEAENGDVRIIKSAYPYQHIRNVGEDIIKNDMILPSFHEIRPEDIGALFAGGIFEIEVVKKPKVAIIPTGSEIVEDYRNLKVGDIIDSNSRMFEAMITVSGGEPYRYSPVRDERELLKKNILDAVGKNDIVIINAGSSAGTHDYTKSLIEELGEVIIHGIAIKPGKPTILGFIEDKPVIGIPGYPVSAYFVYQEFVKSLLEKMLCRDDEKADIVKASLSKRIYSSLKHKEFVRMTLGYVGGKLVATPLDRGAGVSMSLVKADGILVISRNNEGHDIGEEVEIKLLKPLSAIKKSIVVIGSNDPIMDRISDRIKLSLSHVGSFGGVLALKKKETTIAPIHILDSKSGTYNTGVLNKYFPSGDAALIKGIKREQGLMVPKGNPKNIRGIEDLIRADLTFMNRQRGAGTRILLDYNLEKLGIDNNDIQGYEREAVTHMAAAMSVKSSTCDLALGVKSAADILDLDFILVDYEDYDFAVLKDSLEDERVLKFIEYLKSEEFSKEIDNIPGYKLENPGEIVEIS